MIFFSSEAMESSTQVQILNETVSISHSTNNLGKDTNPTFIHRGTSDGIMVGKLD